MWVFRIVLAKYADKLTASGGAARWNSKGNYVVYTASTRALACLENIVHRSGVGLNGLFKTLVIHIPDGLETEDVDVTLLPKDWHTVMNYPICQSIGDGWIKSAKTAVLKIPSAIVKEEYNYVINVNHPEFKGVGLHSVEDFVFDARIKRE